jgi:hypothetical protein
MNTKKFLLSVLAGVVGFTVVSFLLEQLIFKNYMERAFYQPTGIPAASATQLPILAFVVPLAIALIMAYIYPKGYEGGSPAVEGLRFGVLLGLFSGIPFGVYFAITFAIGFGPVLMQILLYALEVTAAGLLTGLVYGRMKPVE